MRKLLFSFFYALLLAFSSSVTEGREAPDFQGVEGSEPEKRSPAVRQVPQYWRYVPSWMRSFMGYRIPIYSGLYSAQPQVRSLRLTLPRVKSQDDDWSCGINSSTRVLKYYGHNVTYDQLRTIRKKKFQIPVLNRLPFARGSVPLYRFGTRPGGVRDILNIYRRGTRIEEETQLSRVLSILRLKKPVITLIRPNNVTRSLPFGKTITLPTLHWIVVSGFDEDQKKIYYYDTTGNNERSYTYDQFMTRWNWDHKLFRMGLRFKPRTIVY